ncbi:MAG: VOC family protein [Pseudomonadota bacterium]
MDVKRGRLIDHLHLRTRDLKASKAFYTATLATLGIEVVVDDTHLEADELWIDVGQQHTHVHLAFQAADRATVDRWYEAGLAAGGVDNGKPGERPYHPGYYAAFLLDPDGNNVEAVFHGPNTRSAEAVTITAG